MWYTRRRCLPELDEQILGIDSENEIGYWTRTNDGWYLSDKRGQIGHCDMRGPGLWTHLPSEVKAEWWDNEEPPKQQA